MEEFINNFLKLVADNFHRDISKMKSLCELKNLRFDSLNYQPNYNNTAIQRLYLLRYAYAYISEYYYLYNLIFDRNLNKKLNVLSIGAGCGLDYYGAYFANNGNKVDLKYCGIDIVDWEDKQSIGEYNIFIEDLAESDLSKFEDVNIILFPKSLFELPSEVANNFFYSIQKQFFKCNSILLISSQRSHYIGQDSNRFNELVSSFEKNGYRKASGGLIEAPADFTSFYHFVKFSCPSFIRPLLESLSDRCQYIKKCPNGCGEGFCDTRNQLNRGPMFSPKLMKIEHALVKRG
ncbi:MAG: hypothetical protein JRG68_07715 [Deltaproteobacteria bacterium]|nr:hypothetical protein [Deltaproteobacteria bacterium]